MFSLRPVLKSLALLVFLVPFSSVVFAQEDDENTTLMTSDDNNDSPLMTNYNALREEGQGFYLVEVSTLYEKPDSVMVSSVIVFWWCDFEFSSDDANIENYGYVGRAVQYFVGATLEDAVAQGDRLRRKCCRTSSRQQRVNVRSFSTPSRHQRVNVSYGLSLIHI